MKFGALVLLTTLATAVHADDPPVCPLGDEWVFDADFSDEFNGKVLDPAKWWDFNPAWYGRKPACFSRENVVVKDGMLHLIARAQKPEEVTVENRVRGYDKFTTATIKSKKRIRYGYFEARCRAMNAGVCNAFWLYDPLDAKAKYRAGNHSEEIDIFEIFGKPTNARYTRIYSATVHRLETPYYESIIVKTTPLPNQSFKQRVDFDFHADFHTYAFLWSPEEMVWFLNGKEMFRRANDHFKRALHIIFDCEIMASWDGVPRQEDLPATFYVDYLRIWRLER